MGSPLSSQRFSHWLCVALCFAYKSSGKPAPQGISGHSTRVLAASTGILSGVSVDDICKMVSLVLPSLFVRDCLKDMSSTSFAHSILSTFEEPT